MSEIELLPCPFCNGEDVRLSGQLWITDKHYIECQTCSAGGPFGQIDDEDYGAADASARWNRRTDQGEEEG